ELEYIGQAVELGHLSGDHEFTHRCQRWLESRFAVRRALLTHSCTAALEMAALLCELEPGDEVVMPSFTFVSTASAFALRGARPVFVDIRPDTLNIDERLIEAACTSRTRALVVVHYAGVPCEMESICALGRRLGLRVIEDAAHGFLALRAGRPLGALADLGCLSFHETKNVISGEGGALLVNDPELAARAEIIWEKGTNRRAFFRGEVDKYTWLELGSSFLPGELTAAFLYAQFEHAEEITRRRRELCAGYARRLAELEQRGVARLPCLPPDCEPSGHIFHLLTRSAAERQALIESLRSRGILAVSHYVPLHSAPGGRRYGRPAGTLPVTVRVSETLVRLPLYFQMSEDELGRVCDAVLAFYR
ncbi:MAG: dTDP-4-amino-4,6-dideoxygalactose transaminase, partial [Betaproteobacteria bacterium]